MIIISSGTDYCTRYSCINLVGAVLCTNSCLEGIVKFKIFVVAKISLKYLHVSTYMYVVYTVIIV